MTRSRPAHIPASDFLAVERCIEELRRGREVVLIDDGASHATLLLETLNQNQLASINAAGSCHLVLSASRAAALDHRSHTPAAVLDPGQNPSLLRLRQLAGLETLSGSLPDSTCWLESETACAEAAIRLARQAHALPALLLYPEPVGPGSILGAQVSDAIAFEHRTGDLMMLGCSRIPLQAAEHAKLYVFRERHGAAEHVAIVVGEPDPDAPVKVRLHSSCFTGDILGSLRCDCGEQLDDAIRNMAADQGGVILYLSQEGRGIGLASKLRAYQLQDEGLNTLEANRHLGFDEDERSYEAAATMLEALDIGQIRLLTNNPLKIRALRQQGIDVVDRLPSHIPANPHNARYLRTKQEQAGHLLSIELSP